MLEVLHDRLRESISKLRNKLVCHPCLAVIGTDRRMWQAAGGQAPWSNRLHLDQTLVEREALCGVL